MDEQASKENPSKDFNKLDLSQLQGFSFGTQWTQDKSSSSHQGDSRRSDERGERPRRSGGGGGDRRDRRNFRKPAGAPGDTGAPSSDTGAPQRDDRGERPRRDFREGGQGGGPRRDFRGGPRRDDRRGDDRRGGGGQGEFRGGPRREGGQQQREHFQGPYFSPYYDVVFYPEDTGFAALVKAIRTSCRTYELFEIARVVIGKNDRFVATIQRKRPGAQNRNPRAQQQSQSAPAADATTAESAQEKPAAPAKLPPLAISIPDGIPFDNEEAAIAHVLSKHLGQFFDTAEVEVDPPKGNYQVINKCGVTGELLGPPNYHLYNQIVQQHHSARLGRMGFETFRSRIETVRDPEVVNQWLEKMKKAVRYTWKLTPPAEGAQPMSFDSFDDARAYLLSTARDKVVRTVETARMHGKLLENMPQGEMRRAIESTLERQRRFPLDTANALRGRLRREGFTIFKRGSKGISYVCAVKRKFRVPGQTFADSIDALIAFIETHPMVKASELPAKFLGIHQDEPAPAVAVAPEAAVEAAPAAAVETVAAEAAPAETTPVEAVPAPVPEAEQPESVETTPSNEPAPVAETAPAEPVAAEEAPVDPAPASEVEAAPAPESAPAPEAEATPAAVQATPPIAPATSGSVAPFAETSTPLSAEDHARLHRLTGDLRWLVSEGYVTEYIDGSLFTYPPMSEARKKEVESEDGDTSAPVPEAHSEPQPEAQPAAQTEPEPQTETKPAQSVAEEAEQSAEQPLEQPPASPEEVAASPEPVAATEPTPAPAPAEEPPPEPTPGTENEPKV